MGQADFAQPHQIMIVPVFWNRMLLSPSSTPISLHTIPCSLRSPDCTMTRCGLFQPMTVMGIRWPSTLVHTISRLPTMICSHTTTAMTLERLQKLQKLYPTIPNKALRELKFLSTWNPHTIFYHRLPSA